VPSPSGPPPGTAFAIGAARPESASPAVPGPLLPSPPTAPHRSPVPALAMLRPPAPPSQLPALWLGLPLTSAPPSEICMQDAASPVPVFTAADATGAGPATTSVDRATASGEPMPIASRASPAPCFGYVPSQQCGLFPLLQSCRHR
jgi:hypothetical protein